MCCDWVLIIVLRIQKDLEFFILVAVLLRCAAASWSMSAAAIHPLCVSGDRILFAAEENQDCVCLWSVLVESILCDFKNLFSGIVNLSLLFLKLI